MPLGKVLSKAEFVKLARAAAAEHDGQVGESLKTFLEFAYDYPVVLNKKGGIQLSKATTVPEVSKYLKALLREYFKKLKGRVSLNDVKTTPDPAVDVVLEYFAGIDKNELAKYTRYHRVSMAAENKIGELLELYLAEHLQKQGWFWCCCNVMTGVDFLKPGEPVTLFQIKNRSNSENSSSEKIRELLEDRGCPVKIQKWHRCNSKDGSTCWNQLPGNSDEELVSEKGFRHFLRKYPGKEQ